MKRHQDEPNYDNMPAIMKGDLAYLLATRVIGIFHQQSEVFKVKILELFHILMILAHNPEVFIDIGQPVFTNIV